MNRAYSLLEVKAINEDRRIISGVATTPTTDRIGDIVDPMGAKFKNPLPLLWQHDHRSPVGEVRFEKPTEKGINFTAQLPRIEEEGTLKQRVDEAWQSVKAKLVKGVSIGFRNLKHAVMEDGGWHFLETEILELSLVTVPANADATIQTIKSIDRRVLAASGTGNRHRDKPPGVSGKSSQSKGVPNMGLKEQIEALEERRAEIVTEMESFGDVTDLDADQRAEFREVRSQLDEVDGQLDDAKAMQRALEGAKPVEDVTRKSGHLKPRVNVLTADAQVKKEKKPGLGFARYAMAMAAGRGSVSDALEYCKRWGDDGKDIAKYIRNINTKAVAGTTLDESGEWGSQLVYADNLASEFVEFLRPMTILGRLTGVRQVPFNVRITVQTSGSTVDWVGERQEKPVSELAFDELLLPFHKIAGIVVLSEELIRLSSPSAEETVRRDLAAQVAQFTDQQFLDPTEAGTSGVNPASITNGATTVAATGTDAEALYADLNAAFATFDTDNIDLSSLAFVMPMAVARGISTLRNALGQADFPQITPQGGTLQGFPVIVSNSAPASTIILIVGNEVLLADDGAARITSADQATLNMDVGVSGSTASFNLWQRNMIGIRAERWVTWLRRRSSAVALITGAAYAPTTASV